MKGEPARRQSRGRVFQTGTLKGASSRWPGPESSLRPRISILNCGNRAEYRASNSSAPRRSTAHPQDGLLRPAAVFIKGESVLSHGSSPSMLACPLQYYTARGRRRF